MNTEKNNWISVDEREPEIAGEYYVKNADSEFRNFRVRNGRGEFVWLVSPNDLPFTHWMPILTIR